MNKILSLLLTVFLFLTSNISLVAKMPQVQIDSYVTELKLKIEQAPQSTLKEEDRQLLLNFLQRMTEHKGMLAHRSTQEVQRIFGWYFQLFNESPEKRRDDLNKLRIYIDMLDARDSLVAKREKGTMIDGQEILLARIVEELHRQEKAMDWPPKSKLDYLKRYLGTPRGKTVLATLGATALISTALVIHLFLKKRGKESPDSIVSTTQPLDSPPPKPELSQEELNALNQQARDGDLESFKKLDANDQRQLLIDIDEQFNRVSDAEKIKDFLQADLPKSKRLVDRISPEILDKYYQMADDFNGFRVVNTADAQAFLLLSEDEQYKILDHESMNPSRAWWYPWGDPYHAPNSVFIRLYNALKENEGELFEQLSDDVQQRITDKFNDQK